MAKRESQSVPKTPKAPPSEVSIPKGSSITNERPLPECEGNASEEPNQPTESTPSSKEEMAKLAAELQAETSKAGIRVEVWCGGECLSFNSADDLLAFVAVVTSGGPGDLYWQVMNYHPEFDHFESSWDYHVRPSEEGFELVETNRGKRWCRVLTLAIDVFIPKKHLPQIIQIFQQHNAEVDAATEPVSPVST